MAKTVSIHADNYACLSGRRRFKRFAGKGLPLNANTIRRKIGEFRRVYTSPNRLTQDSNIVMAMMFTMNYNKRAKFSYLLNLNGYYGSWGYDAAARRIGRGTLTMNEVINAYVKVMA